MGDRFTELAAARDAVLAEAEAFRGELQPMLTEALRIGLERLLVDQAGLLGSFDPPTREAFEQATAGALKACVAEASARLTEPELWLSPRTAPDLERPPRAGWPLDAPVWLVGLFRGKGEDEGLGELDDPRNRIWVAIGSASGPLDGVLQEFGFAPERRRIGGGRFGVAPRTLPRLDPSGTLRRRWKRYRAAFERYEKLARITA